MESTYLNVATGNACAGQSNENPVPLVARNPTSFTDGNCGLLLDAGSKNRTRDAEDIYIYSETSAGIGTPPLLLSYEGISLFYSI